MRKIFLVLGLVAAIAFGEDSNIAESTTKDSVEKAENNSVWTEIPLSDEQRDKIGIGFVKPDFSGFSLIGPFIARFDFDNQSSLKQISPFEITISKAVKFEGESVKRGDIISYVMSDSISNLIYEFRNTKSKLDIAKNNARKDKNLFESGVISQRDYNDSFLLANELELKLKDLQNTITQIGINPSENEASIYGYPIKAKIDGTLSIAPNSDGQKVESFTPYIVITTNNKMSANINVPINNAKDLQKGADIFLTNKMPLSANESIGNLTSVSVAIDAATNTILTRARVDSPLLKIGQNVDVFIKAKNPQDCISIPRDAVTKFANDYIVFVKTKDGFMPTKINIVKSINNGYLIKKDKFNENTILANGAIITLKGTMSGLGFE